MRAFVSETTGRRSVISEDDDGVSEKVTLERCFAVRSGRHFTRKSDWIPCASHVIAQPIVFSLLPSLLLHRLQALGHAVVRESVCLESPFRPRQRFGLGCWEQITGSGINCFFSNNCCQIGQIFKGISHGLKGTV